jgi:uncharacterized protein (DUF58 family)
MPVPTRRLAVVAAVCAVVLLVLPGTGWSRFALVNGALAVVVLIDALAAPSPRRIGVRRRVDPVLGLGVPSAISWELTNPYRRPVRLAVADELAPSLGAVARRVRARVPGGGTVTATAALRPGRRGRFRPEELAVRVDGPFGLVARQHTRRDAAEIRVYPPFRFAAEAELLVRRALEVGIRSVRARGSGGEFDQLREYGPDDEFRRIDWSATARAGRPVVKVLRAERNQHVVVLVDAGRVMAGQVGGTPRLEHAIDAALLLTAVAGRVGDRVGLLTFDRQVRGVVPPATGAAQLGRATEALFDLEPTPAESDYRGAFAAALARFRRRSMFVILTEPSAASVGEVLLPALPLIARRHLVVVAGTRDPDVAAWAAASPADAEAAFRKAAAIEALEARRAVAARLGALGVVVVDAPPGRLAPMLADAYLTAKASGRL